MKFCLTMSQFQALLIPCVSIQCLPLRSLIHVLHELKSHFLSWDFLDPQWWLRPQGLLSLYVHVPSSNNTPGHMMLSSRCLYSLLFPEVIGQSPLFVAQPNVIWICIFLW